MSTSSTHRAIEAVWRIESAKIIGSLARMLRDLGVAEELAQDALVIALESWPATGIPDNPAAWLMAAAKRRALDWLRRGQMLERKHQELGPEIELQHEIATEEFAAAVDEAIDARRRGQVSAAFASAMAVESEAEVSDNLLRLIFTSCHPVLSPEARVALTLRVLGGLTTEEIARAFLVPEATVAQRIVRAKRSLTEAHVPFEVPRAEALGERLSSVLAVLYLVFNEGYAATAGQDWMRPMLCDEALRLGRILAELMPQEAEVHGLVALMEIQASRTRARTNPNGDPILLLDQNRARWDQLLIGRGLAALDRAAALSAEQGRHNGTYTLQAAIAACHARARTAAETDWVRIAAIYDVLSEIAPSPVVELNRAVAVSMAYGPAAGLEIADGLLDEPSLKNYHLLPSVRADFLYRLGRIDEACEAFKCAAALTRNAREREFLLQRAASCTGAS